MYVQVVQFSIQLFTIYFVRKIVIKYILIWEDKSVKEAETPVGGSFNYKSLGTID